MAQLTGAHPPKKRRTERARRILAGIGLGSPILVLVLWIAVNRIEWLGPIVADSLRAVIGKDAVTELQNIAYGVQDRFYQYFRKGEQPKAYWEVPKPSADPEEAPAGPKAESIDAAAPEEAPSLPPFRPEDVGPVHQSWSAPGDGQWVAIAVPDLPSLEPHMWKTLLHPDKNRSWAELFVVAIDIRRADLHLVPGTREPKANVAAAEQLERPGRIPEDAHSRVIAAFNGGFKTEHGSYGMSVDNTLIVKPRKGVCAVALFQDGHIEIASWEKLESRADQMRFWRQTPNCMYEDGKLHPKLKLGLTKKWGATLDGETVIRRSAIGISADGQTIYVGISNHTTANAIALGMHHAGATTVAQLDVNFSYPKFVLFEATEPKGARQAVALADGFEFSPDEFIRKRTLRDFFYLTPRSHRPNAMHGLVEATQ